MQLKCEIDHLNTVVSYVKGSLKGQNYSICNTQRQDALKIHYFLSGSEVQTKMNLINSHLQ